MPARICGPPLFFRLPVKSVQSNTILHAEKACFRYSQETGKQALPVKRNGNGKGKMSGEESADVVDQWLRVAFRDREGPDAQGFGGRRVLGAVVVEETLVSFKRVFFQ